MLRIAALYIVFSGLLTGYLQEILPSEVSIGRITFVSTFFLAVGLALSLRLFLLRGHQKSLSDRFQGEPQRLYSLPFRELSSDLILWIVLGSVLGVLTGAPWWTNWKTTLQLLSSALLIGLLTGAFNFLYMERDLILFFREHVGRIAIPHGQIKMSVASKVSLLLYSIMAVAAVFIGFLVIEGASDMISRCADVSHPHLRRMIFEISAVCLAVMRMEGKSVREKPDVLTGLRKPITITVMKG